MTQLGAGVGAGAWLEYGIYFGRVGVVPRRTVNPLPRAALGNSDGAYEAFVGEEIPHGVIFRLESRKVKTIQIFHGC